ncbi:MAG TPA: serine--tRNA ligase [Thermoanaerobaculia bacterium]|nr:serine--tRNA ligase [Thermoanaerobaculia bacterium]HUM30230.1 serine--tRNA ligase [Thermoanaerobaculia bacterium]HXK68474.1 serine--tRNA ligase [Thermoanaerobaculia bacterium]
MLARDFVRNNIEALKTMLAQRSMADQVDLEAFTQVEEERRTILKELEHLRHLKNDASQEIARSKKEKRDADHLITEMKKVGEEIRSMEDRLRDVESSLESLELTLPNLFHASIPIGPDSTYNRIERSWGEPADFPFPPRPHWEIGETLGILDFPRASKISGARFAVLMGAGARLERALINYFLDRNTSRGYREVLPPFMVNRDSCTGTGQLPKFESDLFKIEGWDYFLVPTAEIPVTNLHREEVLSADQLPLAYCAYTPCFRSEAGSYGKDTRGLIRQHQFNKVELVRFSRPEVSYDELEKLTGHAEALLQELNLPYRVVTLASGDLGFSSAKTYDLEVWLPSQDTYREISSCSNFEDFQARRARIRYKDPDTGKNEFVHTLNGSGLAVGRTLVAILETYQQADGTVLIPEALHPYMGGVEIIEPA